jgi:predicted aspartyl protease
MIRNGRVCLNVTQLGLTAVVVKCKVPDGHIKEHVAQNEHAVSQDPKHDRLPRQPALRTEVRIRKEENGHFANISYQAKQI